MITAASMSSVSNPAIHYDLAVAYREMGLLADAITEFERAADDPMRECVCCSMIGRIHLELGNSNAAIDAFTRALSSCTSPERELALLYDLGDAYLATGRREQARYFFRRLAKLEPGYDDPRGSVEARRGALGDSEPPDSII
jgi:tetratricopeptide (TPR) repeat protein